MRRGGVGNKTVAARYKSVSAINIVQDQIKCKFKRISWL